VPACAEERPCQIRGTPQVCERPALCYIPGIGALATEDGGRALQIVTNAVTRVAITTIFAATLLIGGKTPASAHQLGAGLPTLRWYGLVTASGWPQTLDPADTNDELSEDVTYLTNAMLVKLRPDGTVIPDLATWTVSTNHRVYTFTLRSNARFSNGDPVTAQDVKYSYTRALAKATNSPIAISYMGHITGAKKLNDGKTNVLQGVKVLGARKLQITVDRPIAFFLAAMTFPTAEVVDPRIVAGKKPQTYITDTCTGNVGAGPFKYVCLNNSSDVHSFYPSGQTPSMTLVPNSYYYGPKPHIRIVMRVIANTETSFRVFQANGIDVTSVPTGEIAANRAKAGFLSYPSSQVDYITPDVKTAPFNNIHCRLAVSYAINRDAINKEVLHGAQTSYYDVVPKGMLGFYPGNNNPHYSLTKAKQELAQCPGGIHNVQIPYARFSTDTDNEYAALQAMWQSAGIGITPVAKTVNDWLTIATQPMSKTHTLIVQNGNVEDYPDPQDYCTLLLRTGYPRDIGEWDDPAYNKLADEGEVTFNTTKRRQIYMRAQHIAVSQGAWIPIGYQTYYVMTRSWVHGFVGSGSFYELVPRGNNWANVTISPH
jgi:oligopeptide transport system substrate-binding protein